MAFVLSDGIFMQLHHFVNTFGQDLLRRHGEKIHKLSIHGNFSCPNRDGSLGIGGCTFCNVASFADETQAQQPIATQLQQQQASDKMRARKYLAYFQAYTNTYAEVEYLARMYEEALNAGNIVGLCVGTRPDCVPDAVLKLLASYQQRGFEVWLELGLQSAHDKTLKRINRGHDFSAYADTVKRAQALNINVCTHLIMGLPGESKQDNLTSLQAVLNLGVDGLKLHPLHIVDGSTMAKAWRAGRLETLSLERYVDIAASIIQATPEQVVFHRVTSQAKKPVLLAPDWSERSWTAMNNIAVKLQQSGHQGSAVLSII
jgi:radical SAM protein (TIGR01212 family)